MLYKNLTELPGFPLALAQDHSKFKSTLKFCFNLSSTNGPRVSLRKLSEKGRITRGYFDGFSKSHKERDIYLLFWTSILYAQNIINKYQNWGGFWEGFWEQRV